METDPTLAVDLLAGASDVDAGSVLSATGLTQVSGPAAAYTLSGNSLILDPAQFEGLADGETATLIFQYGVSDGTAVTPQTLTITLEGRGGTIMVAGPLTIRTDEDQGAQTINLLTGATEGGMALSAVGLVQTSGRAVSYAWNAGTLTLDPGQFNDLAAGDSSTPSIVATTPSPRRSRRC